MLRPSEDDVQDRSEALAVSGHLALIMSRGADGDDCRMARAAGVRTDRPPCSGARSARGVAAASDGSGSCSTLGTQTSLGCALPGADLSRSACPHRPRLAATRTDTSRSAEVRFHNTACVVWLACPRPGRAADSSARAATMAMSSPAELGPRQWREVGLRRSLATASVCFVRGQGRVVVALREQAGSKEAGGATP